MAEKQQKPTLEEMFKKMDKYTQEMDRSMEGAVDTLADALCNAKFTDLAKAGTKAEKSNPKIKQLIKSRGAKVVALLATLGVMALAAMMKSHDKTSSTRHVRNADYERNRTMAVLQVLAEDPHAFDGIEIKDSMEKDCLVMNAKVLDAVERSFQKAGLVDKDGKVSKMAMVKFDPEPIPLLVPGRGSKTER